MNQKEVNELKRRLAPNKNAITMLYGCYVNGGSREIISYLDESFGRMAEFEAETYLGLLKKTLSGKLGKNLIDLVFSTQQVQDSDEHRLLSGLRASALQDAELRETFYRKVMDAMDTDENYLILLACDAYDVPRRGKDDRVLEDASETVFTYILCAVCPVKDGKPELGYFSGDREFHHCASAQIVAAPEVGFLFPAFDDQTANVYNALFYVRKPAEIPQKLIDAVFHVEAPLSADEQRAAFQDALTDALGDGFSYTVVQAVHERLKAAIDEHKETKQTEPLETSARAIGDMLAELGTPAEQTAEFVRLCDEAFGPHAALYPANLIQASRFEIATPQAKIAVDPAVSYQIQTRRIDGKPYFLVPVTGEVTVNDLDVVVTMEEG